MNEQYRGIVRLYRDLVQLRLNRKGFSRGLCGQFLNIYHLNDADNMIAFQRWDQHGPGDDVVVVLNFSHAPRENYELGMPSPGLWKLRLNSDATIYSNDFEGFHSGDIEAYEGGRDGLDAHASLSIGPYSLLVFSQDK
jgi:1,4-alpha-glucan branching enzyme